MWGRDIPLKDCHGVNCPLGVAHPPPNSNPRLGGVFPLGCGICRSEKLEVMKKYQMQMVANGQMDQSELFKRWYKCDINRPLFEVDFSGFF